VPGRTGDAVFDLLPIIFGDVARAQLGPVLPGVGAGAEIFAFVIATQHRAGGHEDGRQVHRDCAHDERGRRLVAAAHQHAAVGRIRAEQLLAFHRKQVAIEHGRRLLERLGKADRRHLDGEPARLPDAAFDFFNALLEVRVARIDIAPRIDDRDDRLARVVASVKAHLRGARTVAERAQILHAVPAVAAKLLGSFFARCGGR
jgi:hypothetical protein